MGDIRPLPLNQVADGLIKTSDEQPIGAAQKRLQDGVGNNLPVSVGQTGMTYYGTQDFSSATVTGIGGGGGGGSVAVSHVPALPIQIESAGTDVITYSLLVPAGTFTTGDILVLKALGGNTVGANYFGIWIHTSPALYSGFPIAVGFGSNPAIAFEKTIYIGSETSSRWWDENFPNEGYGGGSGLAVYSLVDAAVDWSLDQYVMLQGFVDPGNVAHWHGVTLSKIN